MARIVDVDEGPVADSGPRRNLSGSLDLSKSETDPYLPRSGSKGFLRQYGPYGSGSRLRLALTGDAASKTLTFVQPPIDAVQPDIGEDARTLSETIHVVDAVARERRRIARDLHDHAGQYFVGIMLQLAALERHITDQTLRSSLHDISETVTRLGDELKSIYAGERCGVPSGYSLVSALANLISRWEREVGMVVHFNHRMTDCSDLDDATAEAVFRIVQEALTNVAKHAAQASRVSVRLRMKSHRLVLEIEDDGPAMCSQQKTSPQSARQHYGILGMRERVEELGGNFAVNHQKGKGTLVVVTIPLDRPANAPIGALQQ